MSRPSPCPPPRKFFAPLLAAAGLALGWWPTAASAQVGFLHDGGTMDGTLPVSAFTSTATLDTVGETVIWGLPVPGGWFTPTGTYSVRYYGSGTGGTVSVQAWMWVTASASCALGTCANPYWSGTLDDSNVGGATVSWSYSNTCGLGGPPGYFCLQFRVTGGVVDGGVTLRYDSASAPAYFLLPNTAAPDAGPSGGGADGGSSTDGGLLPDGGFPPGFGSGLYNVGCDCGSAGAGAAAWLGAASAIALVRRARRRASSSRAG